MEAFQQRRTTIKGLLTRLHTFVNSPNVSEADIKARVETANTYFAEFEEVQASIEAQSEDGQVDEMYRTEVEEKYFSIKSKAFKVGCSSPALSETASNGQAATDSAIKALLKTQNSMCALLQRLALTTNDAPSANLLNLTTPSQSSEIRLPQIQIPDFGGNPTDWLSFKELFDSIIHKRESLSNVEKLHYLRSKLTGEALSVIKHLSSTNDSYQIAWNLITQRYDKSDNIKKSIS